ncbi:MAG: hypothetical protein WCS01_11295 [bacterium]
MFEAKDDDLSKTVTKDRITNAVDAIYFCYDGTPLEHWRNLLNDLYNLRLSKLSPQYEQLRDR